VVHRLAHLIDEELSLVALWHQTEDRLARLHQDVPDVTDPTTRIRWRHVVLEEHRELYL
jgi:hypothetical protein